jgi:4-alpha-glucanotransferase
VANLTRFLAERGLLDEPGDEHALLLGLLCHLGASDVASLLVNLDDLWLEPEPHNVPGTPLGRPNWVQRMRDSLAGLSASPTVHDDLIRVASSRDKAERRARSEDR